MKRPIYRRGMIRTSIPGVGSAHRLIGVTVCLVALATAGAGQVTEAWVARYNGPGNLGDSANALAKDAGGNVYATGASEGSGTNLDYATIKYSSNGNQVWAARYNGPVNNADYATALAVDGAGNVYVSGYSWGAGTGLDYATIKYNSNGDQLWVARYNGPANYHDLATALAVDGAGNVYVTGESRGGGIDDDYATIKYNSNGNQLWVARYNGPGNSHDDGRALAVDAAGSVYVTGASEGVGTREDYATVKYDSNGNQVWAARYNGPGNFIDAATELAVDAAGNVYVAGLSTGVGTDYDYATIKYDSSGNQLWVARYNNSNSGNSFDVPYALAVDAAGSVYVTGQSEGVGTSYDYATIKYDSNGNQLWAARYNGPGNGHDEAHALALDAAGNVYVTGRSDGTNGEYATIKYDSNGNQLWAARYNGPGNGYDSAFALDVDAAGNVYVTGYSWGGGTNYDYATIKYVQHQWLHIPQQYLDLLANDSNWVPLRRPWWGDYYRWPGAPPFPGAQPAYPPWNGYSDMTRVTWPGSLPPPGQCTEFVMALTGITNPPKTWRAGPLVYVGGQVSDQIMPGDVIATFRGGGYNNGHTAVFLEALPGRQAIKVADQNFITGPDNALAVGRHSKIRTVSLGGRGNSNIQSYSLVVRP